MATIVKRGPRRWQAKVRRRGHPTQCRTFLTRAEAERWAMSLESDIIRGRYGPSDYEAERTTLRELIERYIREVTPTKKGWRQEELRLRRWLREPIVDRIVARIRGMDLAAWRDQRLAAGISPYTVRNDLATLSHVFTVAQKDWGFETLHNPARSIRRPSLPRGRDRRLEEGEEDAILAAASSPFRELIIVAIETAMRQSELVGLQWADVDCRRRVAVLRETKNGDTRRVPLSSRAMQAIQRLPRPIHGGPVFGMTANQVQHQWREIRRKTGIQDLRFHDLRHEGTSRLFERGLDMMEVAAITGHKTLVMLRRYTHLRAEDLAAKLG